MTSGSRRIRVACAKCDYNKVRTLEAGDDRTLAQLSASLRCGGCRTWGKNGALTVALADFNPQPRRVHCVCLDCGYNENFRPKWRRSDTLDSLARESTCPACGADGSAGNIYLRAARAENNRSEGRPLQWDILGSVAATLTWPLEMLGLPVVIPLRLIGRGTWWFLKGLGRDLEGLWEPLLKSGAVAGIAAGTFGVGYLACVLIGSALSGPAELVIRAAEHEHRDSVRNSPRGGYYLRREAQAETPRHMMYYNRRTIADD